MEDVVHAFKRNDLPRVRSLVERRPELARMPQLLVSVAGRADLRLAKVLTGYGADWNVSWRGYRPLHALIQERLHHEGEPPSAERLACLDWLLDHGADPEQRGAFPPARAMIVAAMTGVGAFVERLVLHGAHHDGFTAAALGDVRRVDQAIAVNSAFPAARDQGGLTALQCCAGSRMGLGDPLTKANLLRIARTLLDEGADPNARTKSWSEEVDVAYFALSVGDRELVELLLERGADPTAALPSALGRKGENATELAELVLGRGADPDRPGPAGRPLLNELIRWGQIGPALWLLEKGASANIADERGWTAVHQAARRGNARMLEAVLRHGGDPGRKDAEGRTPLEVARASKRPKLVERLRQTPA